VVGLNGSFSCGFENFVFRSFSLDVLIILILFLVFELEIYYIVVMFSSFLIVIILVILFELVSSVVW